MNRMGIALKQNKLEEEETTKFAIAVKQSIARILLTSGNSEVPN